MKAILKVEMVYRVLGAALVRVGVEGIRGRLAASHLGGLGWAGGGTMRGVGCTRWESSATPDLILTGRGKEQGQPGLELA